MTIEIWFDFMCPQSYLLQMSFVEALKQYQEKNIDVLYRSYEMIPGMEDHAETSLYDVIAKHLLIERDEVEVFFKDFPIIQDQKPYPVSHIHRLSHLAKISHKQHDFITTILKDYYEKHLNISDHQYLLNTSLKLGMPQDKILEVLHSNKYQIQVDSNRENAILKGIHRIPHMRINGIQPMYGYQKVEQLLQAFKYAKQLEKRKDVCDDDTCEVTK
jgi:predicted DsbA family dithiol-disulfide isomerase